MKRLYFYAERRPGAVYDLPHMQQLQCSGKTQEKISARWFRRLRLKWFSPAVLINVTWNFTVNKLGGKVKSKIKRRDWPLMHLSYLTDKICASSVHALLCCIWIKRRVLESLWAHISKHLEIKMLHSQKNAVLCSKSTGSSGLIFETKLSA